MGDGITPFLTPLFIPGMYQNLRSISLANHEVGGENGLRRRRNLCESNQVGARFYLSAKLCRKDGEVTTEGPHAFVID